MTAPSASAVRRIRSLALFTLVTLAPCARAADTPAGLPLPDAPVRLHVPDFAAFDRALTGAFRGALEGTLDDSVSAAWRQTQVGSKLEAQWTRFAGDLPWTFAQVRRLRPRALALALLDVGQLETVLVIDTPLALLPDALPAGTERSFHGAPYRVVTPGAADGSTDSDRRMGLAWARSGTRLMLATSARALERTLEAEQAGRVFSAPLGGLIGLDLDLDALRRDRYYKREFLFGAGPESGHMRAALRLEQGSWVEVREGSGTPLPAGARFDWPGAAASGWEPDSAGLLRALRAGLLEPLPVLPEKPLPTLAALPPAVSRAGVDPLMVSLERPSVSAGGPAFEEGELGAWRALLTSRSAGWGFVVGGDGARTLVFAWPETRQTELETLCQRTLERRAGRVRVVNAQGARELQVGPGLPALALKRAGAYVWLGPSAQALAGAPTPQAAGDVVRWGRGDLDALRREAERWQRVEGAASPERVRPFSDRILGLLGWLPETHTLSVERHQSAQGWSERVVFGGSQGAR